MKAIPTLLIAGLLLSAAGCGSDDETPAAGTRQSTDAALENKDLDNADTNPDAKNAVTTKHDEDLSGAKRDGTEITLDESQFGTMLFNSKKQAIYVFEQDSKGKSVCYGECARAWPPVLTDGDPLARKGVQASLLGTVKRRDRKLQVTYAGKPLYYYVNEGPGEVRCHNVNLNGGLWWVVGPDGKRRP
jgi:predicted lipoprotein with Yx(FWY)xxD motif